MKLKFLERACAEKDQQKKANLGALPFRCWSAAFIALDKRN